MTIENIKLFDVIALTVNLPEQNLWQGQVGTIVEALADGAAFEVEFSDKQGHTYKSLGLYPEQFIVLHFDPVDSDLANKTVTI